MHFRTNTFSRRRFSLGLVAAPLAAALGVGASVEPTGADGPPPPPRWSDQELRELRHVPSGQREEGRGGVRAGRRETADSPVEFPAGKARAGLHPHSGGGAQKRAGAIADGGRRPRARSGGAPSARSESGPARHISGQAESRGATDSAGARAADAERDGILRARGAGSD